MYALRDVTATVSCIPVSYTHLDVYKRQELANAAPLIMTGLSVAFAFKTGLFNIGAAGQYTPVSYTHLTSPTSPSVSAPRTA